MGTYVTSQVELSVYSSDLNVQDSEPHILFQFKERNAAE
ncbi:hypothetical protein VIBNIAM115_1580001 [Vibrio nigripulchritudo AM115]|nr:hypothetical protein VIBNIAM115_1580001 [Vibrio nigripulchritudo AM115]